jgi:hypothetical protein
MTSCRIRSLLAWAAGLMTGIAVNRAESPFTLVDPASQWKSVSVQQSVAANVGSDKMPSRVCGPDRFINLCSNQAPGEPDSLKEFAPLLRTAPATEYGDKVSESEATHRGFRGRDLQFAVVTDHGAFDCELFGFADRQIRWGVLYAKAKGAPPAPSPVFNLLRKKSPAPLGGVERTPLRVTDNAVSDFPIRFKVIGRTDTHLVQSIVATEVPEAKIASQVKIEVGDEIAAIDGRPSQEFGMWVEKDSELGRIVIDRNPGDEAKLDLVSAKTRQPYFVTLREPLPPAAAVGAIKCIDSL